MPPDERLGLKGEAFHIGSDGEKARKEREGQEKKKRGSWAGMFHHHHSGGKEAGGGEEGVERCDVDDSS